MLGATVLATTTSRVSVVSAVAVVIVNRANSFMTRLCALTTAATHETTHTAKNFIVDLESTMYVVKVHSLGDCVGA